MNSDEARGPDHRTSYNQAPCRYCDRVGAQHKTKKVFPDDGPPGSWHFEFRCPGQNTTYAPG